MKVSGKIGLNIPGTDVEVQQFYFDENKTIKDIFEKVSDSVNSITDLPAVGVFIMFDGVGNEDEKDTEVSEGIVERGKKNIDLIYDVPKNVAFTQRFQDRVKHDIPNIIESVYDDCKVVNIYWVDKGDENKMTLTIMVEFASENFDKYSKYLDENVGYAVKDIVNYYSK